MPQRPFEAWFKTAQFRVTLRRGSRRTHRCGSWMQETVCIIDRLALRLPACYPALNQAFHRPVQESQTPEPASVGHAEADSGQAHPCLDEVSTRGVVSQYALTTLGFIGWKLQTETLPLAERA